MRKLSKVGDTVGLFGHRARFKATPFPEKRKERITQNALILQKCHNY